MCHIDNGYRNMHDTNLSGFDMNLLVALEALLDECSVTRAARRVGISQPAMSHALRRLRDELGDPLLVREGRAMIPSPRAVRMRGPLVQVLADVRRLLGDAGGFDPASSSRAFTLACPDLLALWLPEILAAMTRRAPGVRLEVLPAGGPDAAVDADLWLGAMPAARSGLMQVVLGRVHWAVVGRRGHPAFSGRFTLAKWIRYPHIQVRIGDAQPSRIGQVFDATGTRRTIGLTVPSFLAAVEVLPRTDHLFTAARELVEPVAAARNLVLKRPPLPVDDVVVAAAWHERQQADPGHIWFRRTVTEVLQVELKKQRPPLPR